VVVTTVVGSGSQTLWIQEDSLVKASNVLLKPELLGGISTLFSRSDKYNTGRDIP
jgi:hypothetical protein